MWIHWACSRTHVLPCVTYTCVLTVSMGWEELEFGCYSCSSFRDKCRLIAICPNKEVHKWMREPPCLSGFCWYGPQRGPNITAQAVLNSDLEQKWVSGKIFQMILVSASITQFDFCFASERNDSTSNPNPQPCPELNNESFFFCYIPQQWQRSHTLFWNTFYMNTYWNMSFQLLQLQKIEKLRTADVSLCQTRILQWRTATIWELGYCWKKEENLAQNDDPFFILTQNLMMSLMVDNKENSELLCWVSQARICTHSHATKYLIWCETTHSNIWNYESILHPIIQLSRACQARLRLTSLFVPLIYLWDSQSGSSAACIKKEKNTHKWRYSQHLARLPCL